MAPTPTRFATFGELMLRLRAPGHERLLQSPLLEATFGGGEANVAASLAQWGCPAAFISSLPEGPLGEAALSAMRAFGVAVRTPPRKPGRLGLYFLEVGSNQRPSSVHYDRANSAFATAAPTEYCWDSLLSDVDYVHLSGISPAVSQLAATASRDLLHTARQKGLCISIDLNYRKKLWSWGRSASDVMSELVCYADTLIANETDLQNALGLALPGEDTNVYDQLAPEVFRRFPTVKRIAISRRNSHSADRNGWSALLYEGSNVFHSRHYELTDIVDRVGSGDAFAAGLLYGLSEHRSSQEIIEFAAAAGCLKHSVVGDFNRVKTDEVWSLVNGADNGRISR